MVVGFGRLAVWAPNRSGALGALLTLVEDDPAPALIKIVAAIGEFVLGRAVAVPLRTLVDPVAHDVRVSEAVTPSTRPKTVPFPAALRPGGCGDDEECFQRDGCAPTRLSGRT